MRRHLRDLALRITRSRRDLTLTLKSGSLGIRIWVTGWGVICCPRRFSLGDAGWHSTQSQSSALGDRSSIAIGTCIRCCCWPARTPLAARALPAEHAAHLFDVVVAVPTRYGGAGSPLVGGISFRRVHVRRRVRCWVASVQITESGGFGYWRQAVAQWRWGGWIFGIGTGLDRSTRSFRCVGWGILRGNKALRLFGRCVSVAGCGSLFV